MSTARPRSLFRNGFDLVEDDGRVVASFEGSVWSEHGSLDVDGRAYELRKRGSGVLSLSLAGSEVATATREGLMSSRWTVVLGGPPLRLAKRGFWVARYELQDSVGTVLGDVRPMGAFSRGLDVRLPAELPAQSQAFVVTVVLTLINRYRRSSAASASAV